MKREENAIVRKAFNLEDVLEFQLKNDVQILCDEDFNYQCYINKKIYAIGLTPMFALVYGILVFKAKYERILSPALKGCPSGGDHEWLVRKDTGGEHLECRKCFAWKLLKNEYQK